MVRNRGFTLVELIMVIVLLAIVATISVQFVALSTQGAIDTGERQQRALKAVVVSEQITRMLREAFPLSVRPVGSGCIEWLPIAGATTYVALPAGNATTLEVIPFRREPSGSALRIIVYGYGTPTSDFYTSPVSSPGPISPEIDAIDNAFPAEIELVSDHRFRERSPSRRLFVVGQPQTLCPEAGQIALYRQYDIGQPYTAGRRDVLTANLVGTTSFTYTPPSLRRAAVVSFSFELDSAQSNETLKVTQEVQIRNVP
ncbi:type II secretion system protein J [Marinobacter lacisalsi]|uniref:Type II secretion system protein J n=1 Tax=Marinobacter lacisalsi TaxID=475979 RepID=A0ABV8QH57_9GAMM